MLSNTTFIPFALLARARRFLALAASLCLLTGAALADSATVIRIGAAATPAIGQSGPVIRGNILFRRIIEEGWLEARLRERSVALEWFPIAGELGPVTNEAFSAKRIDFANIGDLPSIILNSRGVRTQLIVGNGRGSDLYLVVPPDSTAKTIGDLKGKRVSVQSARPWELGFRKLIAANGLQWTDFKTFNLNPQVSVSALSSGKIDAFFGTTGPLFEHKRIGRVIWSTKGRLADKVRTGELWGAREFIDRNPELTQLVATAYVRAQHWVAQEENRDASIKEAALTGTPEEVVRKNQDDEVIAWRDHSSPLLDDLVRNYYRQAVQFALDTGIINKKISADELIDQRFLKVALTDLKLQTYWSPTVVAAAKPR